MKKKILVTFAIFMLIGNAFSQFELKLEPISAIFGKISLAAEYDFKENMGVEGAFAYSYDAPLIFIFEDVKDVSALTFSGAFKFYFNPDKGGDKFYAFPYIRYYKADFTLTDMNIDYKGSYNTFGFGFGVGWKIVANSGILFDFNVGVGKNVSGETTFDDPNYTPDAEEFSPINIIGGISLGYRFGGVKQEAEKK